MKQSDKKPETSLQFTGDDICKALIAYARDQGVDVPNVIDVISIDMYRGHASEAIIGSIRWVHKVEEVKDCRTCKYSAPTPLEHCYTCKYNHVNEWEPKK